MDKAINYLGLARKAGKLAVGDESVRNAVRTGRARLLILASDASPNALRRAQGFVSGKRTILLKLPLTKDELAYAVGSSPCAMVALTDIGFAAAIAKSLSGYPGDLSEDYKQAAETLNARNEKAIRRKKETTAKRRTGYE